MAMKLEQSNIRVNAFNSNLPNLIVLNVASYMHLIRQFDSAHEKCDVLTRRNVTHLTANSEFFFLFLFLFFFGSGGGGGGGGGVGRKGGFLNPV